MVPHAPVTPDSEAFLKSRIDAAYAIAFSMIGMDVLGSAMMAALFWQGGAIGWLAAWGACSAIVISGRIAGAAAYRSGCFPAVAIRNWGRSLVCFSGLSGLLWGSALAATIATGNDNEVMFAVCVALTGLTLSIANVAFWPMYAAFELPVLLSAAIGFAIGDRPRHWMLAGAAAVMTIVMLAISRRLSRQILQAYRLADANQSLVDSLGERRRELEQACDALERVSRTDPLTGLANRRSRDMRLADEWGRALRGGGWLAVIAIDVDHFKRFNDTHGHEEGDRALQAVADMLELGIRGPVDLAARHGGEEFMLILPGVDPAGAASIAERVRVMVARCGVDPNYTLADKVTISLGVAAIEPAPGRSMHELTIAADAALYQAKLGGRNRYEIGTIGPATRAA